MPLRSRPLEQAFWEFCDEIVCSSFLGKVTLPAVWDSLAVPAAIVPTETLAVFSEDSNLHQKRAKAQRQELAAIHRLRLVYVQLFDVVVRIGAKRFAKAKGHRHIRRWSVWEKPPTAMATGSVHGRYCSSGTSLNPP